MQKLSLRILCLSLLLPQVLLASDEAIQNLPGFIEHGMAETIYVTLVHHQQVWGVAES